MPNIIPDTCPHYPNGVAPNHNCNAPIILVTEAPGRTEDHLHRLCVGKSGHLLNEIFEKVGISRKRDMYFTSILNFKPKGKGIETASPSEIEQGITRLLATLARCGGTVIVPTGIKALKALTSQSSITKWRGSILPYESRWIIPTLHPSACLRQPIFAKTLIYDWQKIARVTKHGYEPPNRELACASSDADITSALGFLRPYAADRDTILTFDIEVSRETGELLCVSFSASPSWAISIDARRLIGFEAIRELLESPCQKGGQNLGFDCYVLKMRHGIHVRRVWWDSSWLFHGLDPNAGPNAAEGKSLIKAYSLAYMASVFTDEPYWKDSAKDEGTGEKYGKWKSNWRLFQEYNARDSAVTHEIILKLTRRLERDNRLDFYHQHYRRLFMPLMRISYHGMRFDLEAAVRDGRLLAENLQSTRKQIAVLAGQPLHTFKQYKRAPKVKVNECLTPEQSKEAYGIEAYIREGKSLSNVVILKYLRSILFGRVGSTLKSADESSLRGLKLKVPATITRSKPITECMANEKSKGSESVVPGEREIRIHDLVDAILEFRGTEKTRQFLNTTRLDADSRIRTSYSMLVQTGRLSSSKNPLGTGSNLQNVQRDVRHYFLPDVEGWYILEIDLKQAEDKVVKVLSQNEEAIRIARDNTRDVHTEAAARMFRVRDCDVSKDQRYTGKRTRHARNYGMGPKRLQQILLNDGYVKSVGECQELLDRAGEAEPWVDTWQTATRKAVWRRKSLSNSWGGVISFDVGTDYITREYLTREETMKMAYANVPQGEVGRLLNQYGVIETDRFIRLNKMQSRINLQEHDAVILSCPHDELYTMFEQISGSLTRSRDYNGVALSIPVDATISKHWKCGCKQCKVNPVLEFGTLPTRDEFYARLEAWENAPQNVHP